MILQILKPTYTPLILAGIIMLFLGTTAFSSTPSAQAKTVYGYLEPVTLYPDGITLTAKLDTGAKTASISAKDIYLYKKNGQDYVKFKVSHPDIEETPAYNLPLQRVVTIKKRASESGSKKHDKRPVVKIPIHFDSKRYQISVNLIDRSHFSTPMLLGREALKNFSAIVDSALKNTVK